MICVNRNCKGLVVRFLFRQPNLELGLAIANAMDPTLQWEYWWNLQFIIVIEIFLCFSLCRKLPNHGMLACCVKKCGKPWHMLEQWLLFLLVFWHICCCLTAYHPQLLQAQSFIPLITRFQELGNLLCEELFWLIQA